MSREIGIVPRDKTLAVVWPDVDEILATQGREWLEENELSDQDVFALVIMGHWELWLGTDGEELDAMLLTRRQGLELQVLWLGGSCLEKYLLGGLYTLEQFALKHDLREIVLGGRDGWERVLGKFRYERVGSQFRKDLVKAYAN